MLRKLIIFGLCAGTSASIPIVIERNPDLRQQVLEGVIGDEKQAAPMAAVLTERGSAGQNRTSPGRATTIRADDQGHFFAEVEINGRRVDGLIDTGATMVALNMSTARRLGIPIASGGFVHTVQTANGPLKAAGGVADRLEIGPVAADQVPVLVLEDKALQTVLVGMSFLNRLARFEVREGVLVLEQ